ncbi:MAG TPA: hypothetical protein PK280_11310 [Planctomycetota bacterium]|nr:hypothetical protein [Planctomycetota bacterium]
MSILVVSRDSVVRDLLAVILKNNGVKVNEAHNIDEALPMVAISPKLVFVDIRPQVFWESAELAGLKELLGDAALVLVHDSESSTSLEDAVQVGADAMLLVPFVRSTVLDVCGRLIPTLAGASPVGRAG